MFIKKEIVSKEEAEAIIKEYTEGYISDGFSEEEARRMAFANFSFEYEY